MAGAGAFLLLFAVALSEESPLRIGQIRVRALNVFSPEEAERGWLYRAADAVRFTTRESVIRKFLLFHEGDPYNPTRLEETERNLRAQPFLKSASVVAIPAQEGYVDVEVVTQDAWTTEPGISIGGSGGETTYSFDLKEKDVLGTGRTLAVSYDRGTDRITRLFQYRDPYLFGPYWFGNLTYAVNSDGRETRARVARPFFSFVDRWAADLFLDDFSRHDRLYKDGKMIAQFRRIHRERHAQYGWAISANDRIARRVTVGFRSVVNHFSVIPQRAAAQLPDDRDFRYVFVRYDEVENDFLKWNYVNRDERYEDFNLGRNWSIQAAISPAAFGLDRTTEFLRAEAAEGWRISRSGFLLARLGYQARWDAGIRNAILSGRVFFVRKFETDLLQTFVSHLQFDRGWKLDRDVQFFVDGNTGLRAYSLHAFEGNKKIVWNIEHRFFSGREYFQLVSPGAVIFFDTGVAAPPGHPLRLENFRSDVGVGLRFSISRAASNSVLRIDAAYPLNRDPRGRHGWLFSFSSGQVF